MHGTGDPLISPDYGGWFSRGVTIVKRGWKPLVALQVVGIVLALLVEVPLTVYTARTEDDLQVFTTANPEQAPDFTPLLGLLGLTLLAVLVSSVVAATVTVATVQIGVSVAVGAPTSVGEAVRLAVRRVAPLLGWQVLAIPIYLLGICFCILPVLYVAAVFTVLPVVVAVERTNAIGRSFSLFHHSLGVSVGRIATIIGIGIGGSVAGVLIGSVLDAGVRSATPGSSGPFAGAIASAFVGSLIGAALSLLLAPLTLAAYADMRARIEPLNSTTIAHQLGIVPPAELLPAGPSWPGQMDPPPTAM
jgi:hypothetical protein